MRNSSSLSSDLLFTSATQAVWIAVTLFTNGIIARALGPAGKGFVDYFILVTYLEAEIASLGMASGILYLMSQRKAGVEEGNHLAIVLAGVLGAITCLALVGYALVAPNAYSMAVILAALSSPFILYRLFWNSVAIASNRAPATYMAQLATATCTACGVVLLGARGGLTPGGVMGVIVFAGIVTVLGIIIVVRPGLRLNWDRHMMWQAWTSSRTLFPGHVLNMLTFRLDQLAVAFYFGPGPLGLYALAARLAESFWLLDQVLITTALYRITTLPEAESWALTRRTAAAVAGLGLVTLVLGILFGEFAIVLFFGPAFQGVQPLFVILLFASVLWSIARVLAQYLGFRLGRFHDCTFGAAIGAACTLLLMGFVLLTQAGRILINVALVSVFAYALTTASYYLMIHRANRARLVR